jgi:predicted phage tail protein
MLSYRLYFLGREGRFTRAVQLQCASDEEALRAVTAHADGAPMELWQQARKVRSFAAASGAADAH